MKVTVTWRDGAEKTFHADKVKSERIQWKLKDGKRRYLIPVRGVLVVTIEKD